MAATGKTPILLYGSTTATNVPVAGNLTNSVDGCEIAINVADKNLFFKDSTNAVNTVPIRQSSTSSNGWLSSTDWNTFNNKVSSQWTTTGANIYLATGNAGVGIIPNPWRSNRKVVEIGGNTVASLSLASSIGEITSNFYYDSSGIPKYITAGFAGGMSFNLQTAGGYTWILGPSGAAGATLTAPTVMELEASGNLKINLGNVVIGTSGKGIDFSATPGTGTSELLADYEEGTWTPTVTPATGSFTSVTGASGVYTKVGNIVTLCGRFVLTNSGTGAGLMTIAGLPFANSAGWSQSTQFGRRINDGVIQVGQMASGQIQSFGLLAGTTGIVNGNTYVFNATYAV